LGASLAQGHTIFLPLVVVFMVGLGHHSSVPILKLLASAIAEILFKKKTKFWGAPLAQGHTHFILWV